MASTDMRKIVKRLQSDWNFIGEFLDDPVRALSGFKLAVEERRALTARSADGLLALGFEQNVVNAALSGAHSQTCPTRDFVP